MTRLVRESACKVNLLLNILGKRPDGFHELETVMAPLPLKDTLEFEVIPRSGVELSCSHPDLPSDSGNLVHRAATAFLAATGRPEGIRIHLEKRIPLAAGLGGGSGNAATTLLALNELFGNPILAPDLQRMASRLGSDVPFFLQSLPALATGRGEQIQALAGFPALRGTWLLLIHPGFGVSTAWAYGTLASFPEALNGVKGRAQQLVEKLTHGTVEEAGQLFYNSLEAPVLHKYPILQLYQEFLRSHGAVGTLMSGSGSTTFAVVPNKAAACELTEHFRAHFGASCWIASVPLEQRFSIGTGEEAR